MTKAQEKTCELINLKRIDSFIFNISIFFTMVGFIFGITYYLKSGFFHLNEKIILLSQSVGIGIIIAFIGIIFLGLLYNAFFSRKKHSIKKQKRFLEKEIEEYQKKISFLGDLHKQL